MYILTINNTTFIKKIQEDIVLTKDYNKAISYETIGEAMRTAAHLNGLLGNLVKVIKGNTSVSSNL